MINLTVISNEQYMELRKKRKFIIYYTFCKSPFGECLIGSFGKRICHLSFVVHSNDENFKTLKDQWPEAVLIKTKNKGPMLLKKIFEMDDTKSLNVLLKGTAFQKQVWHALINIDRGKIVSYKKVAERIGRSNSVRAVANAISKNLVAFLVPCHRVVTENGRLHKYKWGSSIKKKILQYEGAFFFK